MEPVKERVRTVLETSFPGADISVEDIRPNKFIVTVVWEGFKGTDEPERQERIWDVLREEFSDRDGDFVELLNYLGFVLTWTEEEKAAYEVG
jgi:acid stress-induced BolA-like protein IbaG/YrbA